MMSLGFSLAIIPFLFAVLRAVSTGTDFRYAWIALAAAVAAAAALVYGSRDGRSATAGFIVSLVASTIAACLTGFALGARSAPSVLFVGFGFAICEAGGLTLMFRAQANGGW